MKRLYEPAPPVIIEFDYEEADKLAEFLMGETNWHMHPDVPLQKLFDMLADGTGKSY